MSGQKDELSGEEKSVLAEHIAGIIAGVIRNMEEMVGPLSEVEKGYITTVMEHEANGVLIRALRRRMGNARGETE